MLPKWMTLFDKDTCHEIFNIVSEFNQNVITIDEARKRLQKQDLSDVKLYKQHVQDAINKILKIEEENKESFNVEISEPVDNATYIKTNFKRGRKPKNVEQ